jgi:GNAT superfamily N-acetyltransferase
MGTPSLREGRTAAECPIFVRSAFIDQRFVLPTTLSRHHSPRVSRLSAPSMLIRRATLEDIPAILPMVRAICDLHQARDPERFRVLPDVLERYAAWLPDRITDGRSILLVAQRYDATLAGYLVGTVEPEVPIFWVPECGWIHDIWIDPPDRRRGIAAQLVEATIAHFSALGIKQMRLHTGAFNDDARSHFAALGFRPSVIEMLRPLP